MPSLICIGGPFCSTPIWEMVSEKNRIDIPPSYHTLRFDQILQFPDQGLPTRRWKWSPSDSAAISRLEGAAVSIEGYLADALEEREEATNYLRRVTA